VIDETRRGSELDPATLAFRSGLAIRGTERVESDDSGGNAEAWLYQERARELRPSRRVAFLRGFVHGEEPGRYVLLSVKEEDISLDDR
jgi:hypothetical protein